MADYSWQESQKMTSSQGSAVLDMQVDEMEVLDDDASDYGTDDIGKGSTSTRRDVDSAEDMRKRIGQNVGEMVWQASKQKAQKAWSVYGNIDILRPYFDIEPKQVQRRLIYSLIPQKPTAQRQSIPRELYGPLMVIFTLVALLLFQMKSSDHRVEEGTLMGTAFGICFIYWFGSAGLIRLLSYICGVRIAMLQILSMLGYALFSHCIVLFLGTVIHTSHDHVLFYLTWAILGGLSTLKMACIIFSRASGKTERISVIVLIAILHLSFLLYLHFAYHSVVEELSMVFDSKIQPPPIAKEQFEHHNIPRDIGMDNIAAVVTNEMGKLITSKSGDENFKELGLNKLVRVAGNNLTGSVVYMVNKTLSGVEKLDVVNAI